MWKNIVEPDRPCMTIWRMPIACRITKATNTHSEYVVLTAFPLQQRLHERASVLRCTYSANLEDCLVLPLALSDNSSIMIETSTAHWWNYTDKATLKYFEEIKSFNVQCTISTVAWEHAAADIGISHSSHTIKQCKARIRTQASA
jgi:hypothetical protein